MLGALRRAGGDPVAALVSLGEDPLVAEILAADARLAGPDGGRTYASEYARRVARGRARGATTAREAAGHRAEPVTGAAMSAMFVEVGYAVVDNLTLTERARVARWNSIAGHLDGGTVTAAEFRRRVKAWRSFRGLIFEWDPAIVVATLDERRQAGETVFEYRGRRG